MRRGNDEAFLRELSKEKSKEGKEREEVLLKATGKAIEKLVAIAGWFQGEEGGEKYKVMVRTGEAGAVDDIVGGEEETSRVRRVSCLEVGVSLK